MSHCEHDEGQNVSLLSQEIAPYIHKWSSSDASWGCIFMQTLAILKGESSHLCLFFVLCKVLIPLWENIMLVIHYQEDFSLLVNDNQQLLQLN